MKIIYIHGATASQRSFAYLQSSICAEDPIYLDYEKDSRADENLQKMYGTLDWEDGPFTIIAHSLGGIYAVYLQNEFKHTVHNVISLATPFDGSEIAIWGVYLNPGYQLFKDIRPNSKFIRESKEIPITCKWTQVVTTVGDVPWLVGQNDGIVTRRSMTCRTDVEYTEIDRNHYEIVQSTRVVDKIQEILYK
jgi:hypothetical protein